MYRTGVVPLIGQAMQRTRGGLVPIRKVFSVLDEPVKELREPAAPNVAPLHLGDLVNQLVAASEEDLVLSFSSRLDRQTFALTSYVSLIHNDAYENNVKC